MTQRIQLSTLYDKPALTGKKILIIVENLPVPFDRRVWQEALALSAPAPRSWSSVRRTRDTRPTMRSSRASTSTAMRCPRKAILPSAISANMQRALPRVPARVADLFQPRVRRDSRMQSADLIFLVALPFKLLGKKFIFDHHDINPELFEAKFDRRGFFWRMLVLFERLTFFLADVVISTNESYRRIAIERGHKRPERVFVVRSGPDLRRVRLMPVDPNWKKAGNTLSASSA